jgi:hypothetical protein
MEFIKLDAATAFKKAINALDGNPKLIVCGSKDNIEYIKEAMSFSELNPQDIIDASLKINVETWFRERMRYAQDELGMENNFDDDEYDDDEFEDESMDASRGKLSFTLATDILTGKPLTDLMGVEIVADECWHIPALFKYGGWNDCPEPEAQCAIWKYWQEKYGAKIVGISHDIIEAHVENPPKTPDEAMQLAMEQYLYCTDIVDQGVETVSNLAHLLLQQKVWYFWWD